MTCLKDLIVVWKTINLQASSKQLKVAETHVRLISLTETKTLESRLEYGLFYLFLSSSLKITLDTSLVAKESNSLKWTEKAF